VARGFESKSVAEQQEAARDERRVLTEPAVSPRRRTLELARADLLRRLAGDGKPAYHEMLRRSLVAVEEELSRLPEPSG
jgi:hypothetical protein